MKSITFISGLILCIAGEIASAASVSLVPASGVVDAGASFDIELVLDANDVDGDIPGDMNGVVTIEYDPTLASFDGFAYTAPAAQVTAPMIMTSPLNSDLKIVALDFTGALAVGSIGTYSFNALAEEGAEISFSIAPSLSGGFANRAPTNKPFDPDFFSTSVSVVPIPASAWLMLSALAFAGRQARRQR